MCDPSTITAKLTMSARDFVQVEFGGIPYSIALSDITKISGSFFQFLVKNSVDAISIQRDGVLFKYVFAYIVNGHLPRDKAGLIDLDDVTLKSLKEEADFYGLEALSKECCIPHRKRSEVDFNSYLTIRKYIASLRKDGGEFPIETSSRLVRALKCIGYPFCVTGKVTEYPASRASTLSLYGDSTIHSVNLAQLIAAATQSPFGRGIKTILDTSVRNSFEINASRLNFEVLVGISERLRCASLAPHLNLTLCPYKLVIYKEGGHFTEHRDTVRGDGHIGTLVLILNSEYTGGELEVTHGGRTEVVTGPYSWVAMYGDCLHKINPVTSGTRVSLIYDIYGTAAAATVPNTTSTVTVAIDEEEEEEEDEEEESNSASGSDGDSNSDNKQFWENQPKGRYEYHPASTAVPDNHSRDPREVDATRIFEALDEELTYYGTIIICLQHLYPECQTNPAFLKGGDRVLYDTLARGGAYDVQVVAATIYRKHDYGYEHFSLNRTVGALFSPAIVKRALGIKSESDDEEEKGEKEGGSVMAARKRQRTENERSKMVIPNGLDDENLLDYTPYSEHAGNEPQEEESVYIVAGLQQVRRRRV